MNEILILSVEDNVFKSFLVSGRKMILNDHMTAIFRDGWFIRLSDGFLFEKGGDTKRIRTDSYCYQNPLTLQNGVLYVYENASGFEDYGLYELLQSNEFIVMDPCGSRHILVIGENCFECEETDVYVNGVISRDGRLSFGDRIDLFGLVIYYYGSFVYANSFVLQHDLKPYSAEEYGGELKLEEIGRNSSFDICIHRPLMIDDIRKFDKPVLQNTPLSSVIPGSVMSLSIMAVTVFNLFNGGDFSLMKVIPALLMPLSMLFASILWPILSRILEKKAYEREYELRKEEYLIYLNRYEDKMVRENREYRKREEKRYFDHRTCMESLHYQNEKSGDFLLLSLGYVNKSYPKALPWCGDDEIDSRLEDIQRTFEDEHFPLFLDLKQYRNVSIISSSSSYDHHIHSIVQELGIKHRPQDISIVFFDKQAKYLQKVYNLPHLYEEGERRYYTEVKQLATLDSTTLQKPTIVIALSPINYVFENRMIHVIYFSREVDSVYCSSDAVVHYRNAKSVLYGREEIEFDYYERQYDPEPLYRHLGNDRSIFVQPERNSFRNIFKASFEEIEEYYRSKPFGLKAVFSTYHNEPIVFDLHEKGFGPHGLIGGTTGSGKTEFLVSMLLSLCYRYPPDYLNLILIDYKGAGIEDSLSYKGKKIPHIVASISNIDDSCLDRLLSAIKEEIKKRQLLFLELSRKIASPVSNIDSYLDNSLDEYGLSKIAHLLIVVDEFAELKKKNADFVKELVSFARVGRSLGIHLILCTQKPGGNIDEEIWSNSRFKVALKLQEERDSLDLIHKKDASHLKKPGQFYYLVDNELNYGESIYSPQDFLGKDNYEVSLLKSDLSKERSVVISQRKSISEGKVLVSLILVAVSRLKLTMEPWNIYPPVQRSALDLKKRYKVSGNLLAIGEIDDYRNGRREIATIKKGETVIIQSYRNNEFASLVEECCETGRKVILIGTTSVEGISTVGYDSFDDVSFLFSTLGPRQDGLVLIVEDLFSFLSYSDDYSEMLYSFIRKNAQYGITVVLFTRSSQVGYKLLNAVSTRITIGVKDVQDQISLFGLRPDFRGENMILDGTIVPFSPLALSSKRVFSTNYGDLVMRIPQEVKPEINQVDYLLGYDMKNREKRYFKKGVSLLICSYDEQMIVRYSRLFDGMEGVEVRLYDSSLLKNDYQNIMWIGRNVYMQKLFYPIGKKDLQEKEAIVLMNGSQYTIRCVDA